MVLCLQAGALPWFATSQLSVLICRMEALLEGKIKIRAEEFTSPQHPPALVFG